MEQQIREIFSKAPLHVRQTGSGRTIYGYAILFNKESVHMWDYDDEYAVEIISPTAITKELLDRCDIKMTMYHNREKLLARSVNGEGTLKYSVDGKGVAFEFEAPRTPDGDTALELVKRGDIAGCSFAFRTYYGDTQYVSHTTQKMGDKTKHIYTVNHVTDVRDFTLAGDPAYPATSVSARELQRRLAGHTASAAKRKNVQRLQRMAGMSDEAIALRSADGGSAMRHARKKALVNKLLNELT